MAKELSGVFSASASIISEQNELDIKSDLFSFGIIIIKELINKIINK